MLLGLIVAVATGWPGIVIGLLGLLFEIGMTVYTILNPA